MVKTDEKPLKIDEVTRDYGYKVCCVTGFSDDEYFALREMGPSAENVILDMLDERNGRTGTCWKCGYGVYSFLMGDRCAIFKIGSSCD